MKPRPMQHERVACERKRRYPDEVVARAFAATLANKAPERRLYVYRCLVCSGWHLTKRPVGTPATCDNPYAEEATTA